MAGEVDPQSDVSLLGGRPRTLHLKMLRKQWQIITLQVIATIALVWMYLEVVSTYVVNSIDHTMVFDTLDEIFDGEVPIGDWITGEGRQGLSRFYVPIILGLLLGGSMALMAFPSYIEISGKPLSERVAILKKTEFRNKILSETPQKLSGKNSSIPPMIDILIENFEQIAEKQFKLNYEGHVDYEQDPKNSIASLARQNNLSVWEQVYNMLLEDDGKALIYYPVYNYYEMNYDNVLTMMRHPKSLMGLSDGGAHVGTICDASFSTYLLSHWTRDRIVQGLEGIDLPKAIMMLTSKISDYLSLDDRGIIAVGKRADINIIDYEKLSLGMPKMVADLPTGSQRLLQVVQGYKYTIVKGQKVIINDKLTNARPGRLIRAG